jgi:hypothetical protein
MMDESNIQEEGNSTLLSSTLLSSRGADMMKKIEEREIHR